MAAMSWFRSLDALAVGASLTCLIHCIGLPLALAALPALTAMLPATTEWFHIAMLAMAVPTSAVALVAGYRQHGVPVPLVVGTGGLVLLATGVAFDDARTVEIACTVVGSIALAAGHIVNWIATRRRLSAA